MKLPILAVLLVLSTAAVAHAQDDDDTNAIDDTPHITIVGTATAEATPDLAVISLGVTSHEPTAIAAANAVAASAQAIVDAAKAQGVQDADIATRSITLDQTFDETRDPQGRVDGRKPSGYDASNTVAIRTRDLAKVGALAQSLIDKGANSFDGIAFSVEHPQPLLDKLAADAVADARRQAEMVARAAGVKLGRVLSIERPASAPLARDRSFAASRTITAMPPAAAMPAQPGSESYASEMEVTWAIDR